MSVTAPPGRASTDPERAPVGGLLTEVDIQVPEGCQNLCDIMVYLNGTVAVPASGVPLKGNGVVWKVFVPSLPVQLGDTIALWVGNRDQANPHTITATARIEEGSLPQLDYARWGMESVGVPQADPSGVEVLGLPMPGAAPAPIPPPTGTQPTLQTQAVLRPADAASDLGSTAVWFLGVVAVGLVIVVGLFALQPRGT